MSCFLITNFKNINYNWGLNDTADAGVLKIRRNLGKTDFLNLTFDKTDTLRDCKHTFNLRVL